MALSSRCRQPLNSSFQTSSLSPKSSSSFSITLAYVVSASNGKYAVEVILQIEHPRETGAGEVVFVPRAIFFLRAQQVGYAARDRIAARIAYREQSQNGPRGLRWSAISYAAQGWIVIRTHRFRPSHRLDSAPCAAIPRPAGCRARGCRYRSLRGHAEPSAVP